MKKSNILSKNYPSTFIYASRLYLNSDRLQRNFKAKEKLHENIHSNQLIRVYIWSKARYPLGIHRATF